MLLRNEASPPEMKAKRKQNKKEEIKMREES